MITRLFNQQITLLRRQAVSGEDDRGNPIELLETEDVITGRVEQTAGDDVEESQQGTWRAFLPAATPILRGDRIAWAGHDFRIDTIFELLGRDGTVHHLEATLEEIR